MGVPLQRQSSVIQMVVFFFSLGHGSGAKPSTGDDDNTRGCCKSPSSPLLPSHDDSPHSREFFAHEVNNTKGLFYMLMPFAKFSRFFRGEAFFLLFAENLPSCTRLMSIFK